MAYGPPLQPPGEFHFEDFFPVSRSLYPPRNVTAIARIGRIFDYDSLHTNLQQQGIQLINSTEQHFRCSELEGWYPSLQDLTPKSMVFDQLPTAETISEFFDWPVFLRGNYQTSRHSRKLSVFNSISDYEAALPALAADPILSGQKIAIREYVRLEQVSDENPEDLPVVMELRTFWWKQNLIGAGPYWNAGGVYWNAGSAYQVEGLELNRALTLANKAVERLEVPFMVVDVARRVDGEWIIIECNDAQECGYGGISRQDLWRKLLSIEKARNSPLNE